MLVKHTLAKKSIEKEVNNASFLLTNNSGGYCLFGEPRSRYNGTYIYFEDLYRIIAEIFHDEKIIEINNKFNKIERKRESFTETFVMPHSSKTFVYKTDINKRVQLHLDVKKSFDNRQFGRYYSVEQEKDLIIIKYEKQNDEKEKLGNEYQVYVVIKCNNPEFIKNWYVEKYPVDKERGSKPFDRHVYNLLECDSKEIIVTAHHDKQKAIDELQKKIKVSKHCKYFEQENLELSFAYSCAKNSLNSLVNKIKEDYGLFAGLPWFFQFWTRDEAISCNTLKNKTEILLRQISNILPDGRIPNIRLHSYPGSPNASADGVGWSFFRLSQIKLTKKEKAFVKQQIEASISRLLEHKTKDKFAINAPLETWMDTGINDVRDNACIEINALRCAMYKFAYRLTKDEKYKQLQRELHDLIRNRFWNEKYLADRLNDFTKRPNVFIAAYVYPELLSKEEWKSCFNEIIPALWLEWGGLSTIDKSNPLFTDTYSGENPISYHRGDSWYWINNLAALMMHKIDKDEFSDYIEKIKFASMNEILWSGFIGHGGELTSAKHNSSEASLCQAWSNAMFIELIDMS